MQDTRGASATSDGLIQACAVLLGDRLAITGLPRDHLVSTAPLAYAAGGGLVVAFRYGAVVVFGLEAAARRQVLGELATHVTAPEREPEEETATVVVRPDQDEQTAAGGPIQLRSASNDHLLIVADVLAKSVALARDERQVAAVLDAIEPFAQRLAARGRSAGGRRRIGQLIGQALLVQNRVSGRVAVRDKPDILWDRPDLERLYNRLEDEYELVERSDTLDRKLTAISSAATALIDLNDADRALRLELTVILLIFAELTLGLYELLRHVGP
jgi:uncharacterized Rmd1/YagE family protein